MISKLSLYITFFFFFLAQLFLSLSFRVSVYLLSYTLTILSPTTNGFPLKCSSANPVSLLSVVWNCFEGLVITEIDSVKISVVTRIRHKLRVRICRGLLGCFLFFLGPSHPWTRKLNAFLTFFIWSQCAPDTSTRTKETTDDTSKSITVNITSDGTPATSDSASTDESTKLNVALESSSSAFVDIPITPPKTPTDALSLFAYTLSPATPRSLAAPCLSPPTPSTPVTSEGPTLVNDSLDEKIKSTSTTVSIFIQKNRRPLAEIPAFNIKPKPKSESSPFVLKTPECKIQTSSSTGKENRPPKQKPNGVRKMTKSDESYYRKDTFMSALKMDMIPIGEGGFGQVFRATALGNRTIAVKLMQRGTVTQEIAIVNEVQALKAAKGCKWAVELVYFQAVTEQALIALTYLPGGDMHSYWERSGFCLDFDNARFYTAQLILAIHDLHCRGIIHRDIKLENMMLDPHRNLKLVDFGLAQVFDHNTVSEKDYPLFHQMKILGGDAFPLLWATNHNPHQTDLANGTEGYAPPEVWKCQMHSFGIDYFAMGCVLHMLITGNAPFMFDQAMQDYKYDIICVDKNMDVDAYDFLFKVLAPRPINRLNLRRMKLHPVFRGIDWTALSAGKIEAPPHPRSP